MNRMATALSTMCLVLLAAAPAARAVATKTETVQFPGGKDGKEMIGGFIVAPEKPGRYGAVIVVHEWWGLNDWVKEQTQKIAEQGYVALAVDLYGGKVTTDPTEANDLQRALGNQGLGDLVAGVIYLSGRKDVDRDRIASVGWSMGAGYSLRLAIFDQRLRACVVNYGALPTDPNDISLIAAPVLGNFGADDRGITPTDVRAFEKSMKTANKIADIKIYDGAGHAFEYPGNTNGYRPEAAADAWTRTINFLNKALK
jgi:carboxymethylenebutenolidase